MLRRYGYPDRYRWHIILMEHRSDHDFYHYFYSRYLHCNSY
jgi:hypothetical protein